MSMMSFLGVRFIWPNQIETQERYTRCKKTLPITRELEKRGSMVAEENEAQ